MQHYIKYQHIKQYGGQETQEKAKRKKKRQG
jgi:hypothetical protein